MIRMIPAVLIALGMASATAAHADADWLAGPSLGLHDLPQGQNRAFQFRGLGAATDPRNSALATDADVTLRGIDLGVMTRPREDLRLVFRLAAGRTDVEYQQIFQDLRADSLGIGVDLFQTREHFVAQAGLSVSGQRFRNTFLGSTDRWNGHTVEVHARLYAPLVSQPGLSVGHFAGGQILAQTQRAHTQFATLLDRETRISRSLFYGMDVSGDLALGHGHRATPWAFVALVHEFEKRPPQRPSALVTGFAPGNAFTLFSEQLANIPDRYPESNTAVFGVGLSHPMKTGGTFDLGLFLERNGDFTTRSMQLNVSFPF